MTVAEINARLAAIHAEEQELIDQLAAMESPQTVGQAADGKPPWPTLSHHVDRTDMGSRARRMSLRLGLVEEKVKRIMDRLAME